MVSSLRGENSVSREIDLPDGQIVAKCSYGVDSFRVTEIRESLTSRGYSVWAGGPKQSVAGGDCAKRVSGELWSSGGHDNWADMPEALYRYLVGEAALAQLLPQTETTEV